METKLQFRLSKEEKSLIKQKSKKAGMKMSEYVRYVSLGDCIIERKITEEVTILK